VASQRSGPRAGPFGERDVPRFAAAIETEASAIAVSCDLIGDRLAVFPVKFRDSFDIVSHAQMRSGPPGASLNMFYRRQVQKEYR
jgi:hypothetical protein